MIASKQSAITRIFDELVRTSRRDGELRRATLKGGAELVVQVAGGAITLTIKRPKAKVGAKELEVFRRDCRVPANAAVLTPPEQATREVQTPTLGGHSTDLITWYFVSYRWSEQS